RQRATPRPPRGRALRAPWSAGRDPVPDPHPGAVRLPRTPAATALGPPVEVGRGEAEDTLVGSARILDRPDADQLDRVHLHGHGRRLWTAARSPRPAARLRRAGGEHAGGHPP